MKRRILPWLTTLALSCAALPLRARAWEPFRSENSEVLEGNRELQKGALEKAIAAYSEAAKRLPQEAGVHLDRGIALLKAQKLAEAREALRLATQGEGDADVRAKAHYNLGLTFLDEADGAAKAEDLDGAQKLLRESVDAFKSSLRAGPKNRDAAWNLELARRRLVDVEKKQQEKRDQEKKEQDEKDKQDSEDQQSGDSGDQDKQPSDQDEQGEGDKQKPDQGDQADAGEDQKPDEEPEKPESGPDAGAEQKPQEPEKPEPEAPQDSAPSSQEALPEHMQKALDALSDSEENLQKHRAAMRARQRPRRIEKDW